LFDSQPDIVSKLNKCGLIAVAASKIRLEGIKKIVGVEIRQ